ncbi:MAG: ATPase domain-containing protein [Candidatus Thermoplasmatota archaeon]
MVQLGIRSFDEELGDIPTGSKLLLSVAPGIDPTPFGLSIASSAAMNGIQVIYLTNNKPSSAVWREIDILGYKDVAGGSLQVLDAFSAMIGLPGGVNGQIQEPFDQRQVISCISQAAGGKDSLVVIDNLSSWVDNQGMNARDVFAYVQGIAEHASVLALFSAWAYGPALQNDLEALFDAVISLKPVEEVTVFKQMAFLRKVNWRRARQIAVPIKVLKPGGLRIYVPKILITGPYGAGKSTMTRAISTHAVSVDRMGTTVALDHGYLDYGGFSAEIFGTPGQEMFDPILAYLADEAVAIILVVDSSDLDSFGRAAEMLEKTRALNLPLVVAANHADSQKSVDTEIIRSVLGLPDSIPIVKTVAPGKKGVTDLLNGLITQIMGVY